MMKRYLNILENSLYCLSAYLVTVLINSPEKSSIFVVCEMPIRVVTVLVYFTDSSVTMANVEHQLMYMYDADVINHLVTEMVVNQQKSPSYVMQLNNKVSLLPVSCS